MPKLARPNSDAQRLQALGAAKTKYEAVVAAGGTPLFSATVKTNVDATLTSFLTEVNERGAALSAQTSITAAANPARHDLRMYVAHFIRVFNMGVERGVYAASDRAYYGLAVSSNSLPYLNSDSDLQLWATNIKNGETARVAAGGTAMSNPTAAEVDAQHLALQMQLSSLTTAKDAYDTEQEDVENMRPAVDELIDDVWDEVLFALRKEDAPSLRRKAREYGVVYSISKGEEPSPAEYSAQGTVTDTEGNPLFDVEVTDLDTNTAALTDEAGRYLMPKLPAGNRSFVFKKDGYQQQTVPVTVTDDEVVVADVVMVGM